MKFLISSLLALLPGLSLAADLAASAPEPLYVLSAQAQLAEDGKPLTMIVRETTRTPDASTVSVDFVSGGSASSLFLVRALCGLMQTRGQALAVAEQISERPVQFRMTFPQNAEVEAANALPRMVLTASNCARIQGRQQ